MKSIAVVLILASVVLIGACANPFLDKADFAWNGRVRLETLLVMPEGGQELKPAVVFAGGSAPWDFRDYTEGYRETFIEGVFLERDYAVMYYNKRGIGESTGSWKRSSIEERADDLIALVDYLKTQPGIDPNRIGLVGHSQGGWVVQLAASLDQTIAFVISLAGPTVSVREQDSHFLESQLRCEGYTDADIAAELEDLSRQHDRKIALGSWFPFFQMEYSANIFQYDPRAAILGLTQPTLLAYGEADGLVPPAPNRDRYDEIFPAGPPVNHTWHVVSAADHAFHITNSTCVGYEESLEMPYSHEFVTYLSAWVDGLGF